MATATTAISVPIGEMTTVQSSDEIALSETDRSRLYMFLHSGQQAHLIAIACSKVPRGPFRLTPAVALTGCLGLALLGVNVWCVVRAAELRPAAGSPAVSNSALWRTYPRRIPAPSRIMRAAAREGLACPHASRLK